MLRVDEALFSHIKTKKIKNRKKQLKNRKNFKIEKKDKSGRDRARYQLSKVRSVEGGGGNRTSLTVQFQGRDEGGGGGGRLRAAGGGRLETFVERRPERRSYGNNAPRISRSIKFALGAAESSVERRCEIIAAFGHTGTHSRTELQYESRPDARERGEGSKARATGADVRMTAFHSLIKLSPSTCM